LLGADILIGIFLMLLLGKLLGDLCRRFGFSALIGQMFAGILLGPMCLGLIGESHGLELLAGLGILFMMFIMGLSVDFEKVMKTNLYGASFISLLGGALTFFAAMAVTVLLGFPLNEALLVGIAFISTSTAIGFMVFSEVGDRHSNVFKTIMAVGTTDDVFAMLALSLYVSYLQEGVDVQSAFRLFLLVLGFIVMVLWLGRPLSDKLIKHVVRLSGEDSVIIVSMIILFAVAYLSDGLGIAEVTGAFLAGTILARSYLSFKIVLPKIEAVSEGFFVPLFFVYTGTQIDIREILFSSPVDLVLIQVPLDVVLFIGLLIVVMASKYFATYLSALTLGGFKELERVKLGLAMTPMGEYTLVIGQIGLVMYGMTTVYSVLALVVLITSIISPIMLRNAYRDN
jgi:Kef-type K+ transport system membrane component KefB